MEGILEKKKETSVFGGWQKKYFKVQNTVLNYYQKPKDAKPKGSIDLRETVEVLLDEGNARMFTIVTAKRQYTLKAPSPEECLLWVEILSAFNGMAEYPHSPIPIPEPVAKALQASLAFLLRHGINHEGLFRVCGSSTEIDILYFELIQGGYDALGRADIHVCAGVVKKMLQEMPETLLTNQLFYTIVNDAPPDHNKLNEAVHKLPDNNRHILELISQLMVDVCRNHEWTQMTSSNLAVCIGPSIGRKDVEEFVDYGKLFQSLIYDKDLIFYNRPEVDDDDDVTVDENESAEAPQLQKGWGHGEELEKKETPHVVIDEETEIQEVTHMSGMISRTPSELHRNSPPASPKSRSRRDSGALLEDQTEDRDQYSNEKASSSLATGDVDLSDSDEDDNAPLPTAHHERSSSHIPPPSSHLQLRTPPKPTTPRQGHDDAKILPPKTEAPTVVDAEPVSQSEKCKPAGSGSSEEAVKDPVVMSEDQLDDMLASIDDGEDAFDPADFGLDTNAETAFDDSDLPLSDFDEELDLGSPWSDDSVIAERTHNRATSLTVPSSSRVVSHEKRQDLHKDKSQKQRNVVATPRLDEAHHVGDDSSDFDSDNEPEIREPIPAPQAAVVGAAAVAVVAATGVAAAASFSQSGETKAEETTSSVEISSAAPTTPVAAAATPAASVSDRPSPTPAATPAGPTAVEVNELRANMELLEERNAQLIEVVESNRSSIDQLTETLLTTEGERDEARKSVASLQLQVNELSTELSSTRSKLKNAVSQRDSFRIKLNDSTRKLNNDDATIQEYEKRLAALADSKKSLSAQFSAEKEHHKEALEELQLQLAEMAAENKRITAKSKEEVRKNNEYQIMLTRLQQKESPNTDRLVKMEKDANAYQQAKDELVEVQQQLLDSVREKEELVAQLEEGGNRLRQSKAAGESAAHSHRAKITALEEESKAQKQTIALLRAQLSTAPSKQEGESSRDITFKAAGQSKGANGEGKSIPDLIQASAVLRKKLSESRSLLDSQLEHSQARLKQIEIRAKSSLHDSRRRLQQLSQGVRSTRRDLVQ